jgi:hypothetical protein
MAGIKSGLSDRDHALGRNRHFKKKKKAGRAVPNASGGDIFPLSSSCTRGHTGCPKRNDYYHLPITEPNLFKNCPHKENAKKNYKKSSDFGLLSANHNNHFAWDTL